MSDATQMSRDLQYVRGLVDPAARPHLPRAVMLVLAAMVLIGFPLPDFVGGDFVLRYWLVAGSVGFIACAALSARAMRRSGQEDLRSARRYFAHWALLLVAGGLALLLPQTGTIDWSALAPMVLLLVAFAYLTAGVHLDVNLAGPGIAFALGYCLLAYRVAYAWTITGVVAALALVLSAELTRRHSVASDAQRDRRDLAG